MKAMLEHSPSAQKTPLVRPCVIIFAVLVSLAIMGGVAGGGTLGEPLLLRPLVVKLA
jgi:ABC-type methionine transport system permease subunit